MPYTPQRFGRPGSPIHCRIDDTVDEASIVSQDNKDETTPVSNRISWDQFLRFTDTPPQRRIKSRASKPPLKSETAIPTKKTNKVKTNKKTEIVTVKVERTKTTLNTTQGSVLGRKRTNEKAKATKPTLTKTLLEKKKDDTASFQGNSKSHGDDKWNLLYKELIAYAAVHGGCRVNQRDKQHAELGAWVKKQRKYKKINLLCLARQEKLDKIGFVWDARLGK